MKSTLKFLLFFAIGLLALWGVIGFIAWDWDVKSWHPILRYLMTAAAVIVGVIGSQADIDA